ncbi:tRNA (guanosine(46)-N7)-methyltransferase TrmB [Caenispirillum bisanense]
MSRRPSDPSPQENGAPSRQDGALFHAADPRFYGRRKGKRLKSTRQRLVEDLLPQVAVAEPAEGETLDLAALFPRPMRAYALEVGFGNGEHLAGWAARHPDIGFIGAEPFINGVGALLVQMEEQGLDNIRVFTDDVRRLLPAIPANALEKVFVLFPDPWPKTRHARRRFINVSNLDLLAERMVDGAELRVASDDMVYVRWSLIQATNHPAFRWTAGKPEDWRQRWPDGFPTRYEAKQIRGEPKYLTFCRLPREA